MRYLDLWNVQLRGANLTGANLTGARISCISARGVQLNNTLQSDLIISELGQSEIVLDNLEFAQFIDMMLRNTNARDMIGSVANKAVLILGHFADKQRLSLLNAMRDKLRAEDYLPITFNFGRATEGKFTETIRILAGMSLFVIADMTSPHSDPFQLQATIPNYAVPFVAIIQNGEQPFAIFSDLQGKYRWALEPRVYANQADLIEHFNTQIIRPALEMHKRLLIEKKRELNSKSVEEF